MQRALAETGKIAIGQLIMGGRAHLVGIKALEGGLMLSILRYADVEPEVELIEAETGRFEPEGRKNQAKPNRDSILTLAARPTRSGLR